MARLKVTVSNPPMRYLREAGQKASDTPVVGSILDKQLAALRDCGEIVITQPRAKDGGAAADKIRARTKTYDWHDEITYRRQATIFPLVGSRSA